MTTLTLKDLPLTRPLSLIYHKDKILTWAMQELLRRLDNITRSDRLGPRTSAAGARLHCGSAKERIRRAALVFV